MFAIRNKKSGAWVCGTDYRYFPHHQITSFNSAFTYDSEKSAEHAFFTRGCSKRLYAVVEVTLTLKTQQN